MKSNLFFRPVALVLSVAGRARRHDSLVGVFCGGAAHAAAQPGPAPGLGESHRASAPGGGRGAQTGERYLRCLDEFFAEKHSHARGFAEDVLSWGGKWAFVQSQMPLFGDDGKSHREYLRQAFERHLFSGPEFQSVVKSIVTAYLSELEGQENELLVAIRADLGDEDLPGVRDLAALRSDEAFQGEYRKMLTDVIPVVGRELLITVGREAVVWVGADIATAVTTRVASAAASRLGVSGGILGTGAATGVETLGIGLVAGFVVDAVVDWVMRSCWGHDPEGDIARHAGAALDNIQQALRRGRPGSPPRLPEAPPVAGG